MPKKVFLAIMLVAGLVAACSDNSSGVRVGPDSEILTCFVPSENCTQFIVEEIKKAQEEILVQAYSYTSPPILQAIAEAKTARKLTVKIILDKSNEQTRYTGATYMQNNGIPVLIDGTVSIAHNKVVIIDRKHVITGSFNFTVSAQKRNAENVILIKNNPAVAKRYIDNWENRARVSRPFGDTRP